jgi:uncharacterized membrane protein YfcA
MSAGIATFVVAPFVVLVAYVIFGIASFGSTLFTVPLLAHLFPLTFVIPIAIILDAAASVTQGIRLRAEVNRRELVPLLPFLLAGIVLGVALLIRLPGNILMACLGIFTLAYGANYLIRHESPLRFSRWTAGPIGIFAGVTSSLFGIAGPIYVMYLAGRGATPEQIRATVPVIFIFTTIARIAVFSAAGLIGREVLLAAALLLPLVALGLYIGNRLHGKLSRERAVRVIGALLVASGASLLLRAL